MTEINEFRNNKLMNYVQVAKGEIEVDLTTFNDVYELLPSIESFDIDRSVVGKNLLGTIRIFEPSFVYYQRQEDFFIDDPQNFDLKVINGSSVDRAISGFKDIQSKINELFGHYSACLYLLNFLIQRNRSLVNNNVLLLKKYEGIVDELNDYYKEKELNDFKVNELYVKNTKVDGVLALTEEEKKQPVVVESEEEIVDRIKRVHNKKKKNVKQRIEDKESFVEKELDDEEPMTLPFKELNE